MPKVPRSDISWGQGAEETGKPGQQERALTVQPLGNTKATGALRVTGVLLPTQTDPSAMRGMLKRTSGHVGKSKGPADRIFVKWPVV